MMGNRTPMRTMKNQH
ncbi:hypothetical protein BDFB_015294 [Asbolus verrucosus]|uniref:Uncharacterized protein n=1 Tax=Asbolus verrucosus TaxID=1661398 RepID=A0A482VB40_ASBVE|nr:hypothetical protein BDFB_015294 [Asbolus verrucosus]